MINSVPHVIRFGAKLMASVPLEIYRDKKRSGVIEAQVYELDSPDEDIPHFQPYLTQWESKRDQIGEDSMMHSGALQDFFDFKSKRPDVCHFYVLTVGARKVPLGVLAVNQFGTPEITDMEKTPVLSISNPQRPQVRNILKGLLFVALKQMPQKALNAGLQWSPLTQAKMSYQKLFKDILTQPLAPNPDIPALFSITGQQTRDFMTHVQTQYDKLRLAKRIDS